ncbi:MAG: mechanosensitive ion channel [Anaerolineae bacterium]|nr:mechanosensitive ion channel [Anaerolineae bacterium]
MDEIQTVSGALEEIASRFLLFLPDLVAALVIFVVGIYVANLIARLVRRALLGRGVNVEAAQVITQITRWSLVVLVSITALEQVRFDLRAFIAGLGIVGFTIGFALKDISENFVAGLMLLLQRPFELGDIIEIDDFRGRVTSVSLRATEMETLDGQNIILPNGLVYTSPLINYTRAPLSRIDLDVGVAYGSDLDQVRRVAIEAAQSVPVVLSDPPPYVVFHTFADSSIELTVFYWIDGRETPQFRAKDLVLPVLKRAFENEGIEIPFPIRTLHMEQTTGAV